MRSESSARRFANPARAGDADAGDGGELEVFAQPGSPGTPPRLYYRLMVRPSDNFPAATP